jgi:hypothetical protein
VEEREVGGAEWHAAVVVAEPDDELEALRAAGELGELDDAQGLCSARLLLLLLHHCPQPSGEGAYDALLHCNER